MKCQFTIKTLTTISLLILLACGFSSLTNASTPPTKQDDDWNEIIKLHNDGAAAFAVEAQDRNQRPKRIAIYRLAATKLATFIQTYFTNHANVTYLRGIYRLAVYLELAGKQTAAAVYYQECLKHPLINAKDALYDDKPIAELCKQRVAALKKGDSNGGWSANPP